MTRRIAAALGFFLLCGTAVFADYPSLGKLVEVPEAGVRVRVFKDAKARPLPILNRRRVGNAEWVIPSEWWYHEAHAGAWDTVEAAVIVGVPSRPPVKIPDPAATAEALDRAMPRKSEFSEDEMTAWIETFAGGRIARTEPDGRIHADRKVMRYEFRETQSKLFQVGFLVTTTREPVRRVFVLYVFQPQKKESRLSTLANDAIAGLQIESLKPAAGTASSDRPKRSDEYERSRRRVIDNIRSYKDWWFEETEHFIVVSNMREKRGIRMLLETLEECRTGYAAYFSMDNPVAAVSTVRFFRDRDDYVNYVGEMGAKTIGVWMPSRQELAISPVDLATRSQRRDQMVQTLRHEAFHQYIHYAVGEVENAMWFNEGTAEYFEGMEVRGSRVSIKPTMTRRRTLDALVAGGKTDFGKLLNMDYETFYGEGVEANYALAGALVYYLYKGGNPEYRKIPDLYYRALIAKKDWRAATAEAWDGIDMAKFTADFQKFWRSRGDQSRAESFDPLTKK